VKIQAEAARIQAEVAVGAATTAQAAQAAEPEEANAAVPA
jgi:hypothetical protein